MILACYAMAIANLPEFALAMSESRHLNALGDLGTILSFVGIASFINERAR